MEVEVEERESGIGRKKIRLAAALFLVLLAILTLAGNTLQALTLPRAYTAETQEGELAYEYKGTATAVPADVRELRNPAGWSAAKVLVKAGDAVTKGQLLVEYDSSEAAQQLEDSRSALKKLKLSMENLQLQYKQAAISEDETAIIGAKLAIETAKIDIFDLGRRIGQQEASMANNSRLLAPFDGIVLEVGAVEGMIGTGLADVRLMNAAGGFIAELAVPGAVAALLGQGEELELQLVSTESRTVNAAILSIETAASGQMDGGQGAAGTDAAISNIKLKLDDPELHGGEKLQANIRRTGGMSGILVPAEAVRNDLEGSYVYILEERQGPLGNAYYAVRTKVDVAGSNGTAMLVVSGLFAGQRIIIGSSEMIIDGARVRI